MNEVEFKMPLNVGAPIEVWIGGECSMKLPASVYRSLKREGLDRLSLEELKKIALEKERKLARSYAVFSLSRRALLSSELTKKLQDKGYSNTAICDALSFCEKLGALSDKETTRARICRLLKEGKAPAYIRMYLKKYRVESKLIDELLDEMEVNPKEAIRKLIVKRKERAFSLDMRERKREIDFLLRRGFSLEDILAVLRSP